MSILRILFTVSQVPRLETIENVMRLSQMIIQGSWDRGVSPLSQLPYLQHSHFYDKRKKKVPIDTIAIVIIISYLECAQ